jgi:hypothetical protein
MTSQSLKQRVSTLAAIGVVLACVAGCAPEEPEVAGPAPAPTITSAPSNTAPAPPSFVSDGDAEQNLAVFEWAGQNAVDAASPSTGDQLVSSLVDAGFAIAVLEVTPDKTAAGFDADSIFVAARFGAECLVGQARNSLFTAIVTPALSNQNCLVGAANRLG